MGSSDNTPRKGESNRAQPPCPACDGTDLHAVGSGYCMRRIEANGHPADQIAALRAERDQLRAALAKAEAKIAAMTESAREVAEIHNPKILEEMALHVRVVEAEAALAKAQEELKLVRAVNNDFGDAEQEWKAKLEKAREALKKARAHIELGAPAMGDEAMVSYLADAIAAVRSEVVRGADVSPAQMDVPEVRGGGDRAAGTAAPLPDVRSEVGTTDTQCGSVDVLLRTLREIAASACHPKCACCSVDAGEAEHALEVFAEEPCGVHDSNAAWGDVATTGPDSPEEVYAACRAQANAARGDVVIRAAWLDAVLRVLRDLDGGGYGDAVAVLKDKAHALLAAPEAQRGWRERHSEVMRRADAAVRAADEALGGPSTTKDREP